MALAAVEGSVKPVFERFVRRLDQWFIKLKNDVFLIYGKGMSENTPAERMSESGAC